MLVKQISLAALATILIAASAAVARAESNISGVDGGPLLQRWRSYGGPYAYSVRPYASGMRAYGYAGGKRHYRSRAHARTRYGY
jgi:hypothetical protein